MGVPYFGLIVHLNAEKALLFFASLVIGLVLFDKLLESVEHRAHAAKFGDLVDKVYKEMMMMGFIGFILFLTFNSLSLKHDENYMAFEFAHITIFFMAIVAVFRACFVIYVSNKAIDGFWRAQNQDCKVLLRRYKETKLNWMSLESILFYYFPILSNLFRDIEYKLMEDYFYEDYKISRHEFRFLDYLSISNKLYAMEMLETSPLSWGFVCFLAVLNFIRIEAGFSCADDEDSQYDHNRLLEGGDDDRAKSVVSETCAEYTTIYFLLCGLCLLIFGLFVSCLTWRSQVYLMQIASDNNGEDYEVILKRVMEREKLSAKILARRHEELEMQENDSNNSNSRSLSKWDGCDSSRRLDIFATPDTDVLEDDSWHVISLRQVIGEHKKMEDEQNRKQKPFYYDMLSACGLYEKCKILIDGRSAKVHGIQLDKMEELRAKRKLYHTQINSKLPRPQSIAVSDESAATNPIEMRRNAISLRSQSSVSDKPAMVVRQASMRNKKVAASASVRRMNLGVIDPIMHDSNDYDDTIPVHPLMFELDQIFLFESRRGYKFLVELYQILNALFIAMWLTNFALIAIESRHAVLYSILIAAGIFLMLYMLSFIQFHATCILAVTSLRNEASEWICEQDIMKSEILPRLREELLKLLDDKHFVKEVTTIFNLVKDDRRNGIGFKQFHELLKTLNLYFSDTEVKCLFRIVDTDGSGSIELSELKELLRVNSSLTSRNTENDVEKKARSVRKGRQKRLSGTLHMTRIGSMPSEEGGEPSGSDVELSVTQSRRQVDNQGSNYDLITEFD